MRETNFCRVVLLGDFKDNIGILPFALVCYEVEKVVHNVPNNPPPRNKLSNFEGAAVNVLVVMLKFAKFVGSAFNIFRPPSADVIDGGENFVGALVYIKGSCVILIHVIHILFVLDSNYSETE
ncbi:hypothetical protein D3C87_1728130 [compost metagenome]